jgi:hypothetical protein
MIGDEEQRPLARHVVLTLDPGVARQFPKRPRAARPEAGLTDYSVVGQDLARQTPGRSSRERFEYSPPATYSTQTEGGDHIVHACPCETFETLLVLGRKRAEII